MKKVIILSFLFVNLVLAAYSQSEKYTAAMTSALTEFATAKTPEAITALEAKFERIANAEKNQWLPYYYAAMLKTNLGFAAEDKDKAADEAEALLNKADSLEKNNSEIYCVKAMICYVRLMANPQARWMKYGAEATKNLDEAKKADPKNPRPILLNANSVMNMPEAFGGGCANAKPIAEQAAKLYADFKPASALHPSWGKDMCDDILGKCK